jgi:hypothetical protein
VVKKRIYVLQHPKSGAVRYVGATVSNLPKRLALHLAMMNKNTSKCAAWLRGLAARGLRPTIQQVTKPVEHWERAETRYISLYRAQGKHLLNMTDGGRGQRNCFPDAATRAKRSSTLKARYASDPTQMAKRQELMRCAARHPNARAAASARMTRIWSNPKLAAEMRTRMKGAKARKAAQC